MVRCLVWNPLEMPGCLWYSKLYIRMGGARCEVFFSLLLLYWSPNILQFTSSQVTNLTKSCTWSQTHYLRWLIKQGHWEDNFPLNTPILQYWQYWSHVFLEKRFFGSLHIVIYSWVIMYQYGITCMRLPSPYVRTYCVVHNELPDTAVQKHRLSCDIVFLPPNCLKHENNVKLCWIRFKLVGFDFLVMRRFTPQRLYSSLFKSCDRGGRGG